MLICTQCNFVINRGKNNLYEFKMSQQKVWFMASRGFGPVWTEAVLKRGDKVAASARNPKALTAFSRSMAELCWRWNST